MPSCTTNSLAGAVETMCGFAGFFHPNGRPEGAWDERVRAMTRTLVHRGPDGDGFFVDAHIALGHRRLIILDREGGVQPMANDSGSVQVVFNGEIYNDPDLRQRLAGRGHRFRTASDTESIVRAYEEWGVDCVEQLDGMFAFALWDADCRRLLLARDRVGKKPLYYAQVTDGGIAFASELKALDDFPGIDRSIDIEALSDYLSLSYVPREKTFARGVRKLLPGHTLEVSADGCRLRRYWEVSFAMTHPRHDDTGEVRAALAHATEVRLRSDVPLGAFLSGGLDSSSVVGLMVAAGAGPVQTTAIGFEESAWDERPFAELAARAFGAVHRDEVFEPITLTSVDQMLRVFDEPFADSSALPTYQLSRLTRQRVSVALSGDGGDEVFAGYRRYAFDLRENRVRDLVPGGWGQRLFAAIGGMYPHGDSLAPFLRGRAFLSNVGRTPAAAYFHSVSAIDTDEKDSLLHPDLRARLAGYRSETLFEDLYQRASGSDALGRIQFIDFATYLPDDILTKVDRTSMAHSLEVRCPLLDRRLVELVASLPSGRKLRGGRTKIVLREAMRDLVPAPVMQRSKMGFTVPLGPWLRSTSNSAAMRERILDNRDLGRVVVQDEVRRIWQEHRSGQRDRSRALWILLMLAAWLDARRAAGSVAI